MSAVQDAVRQRQRRFRLCKRCPRWALPALPPAAIGYVLAVVAADLALAAWLVPWTSPRAADVAVFLTLMACGALCVEATRRLSRPPGDCRDLMSAWWLPVALLLPPAYAVVAPAILGVAAAVRIPRSPAYRRVFSAAALGLAGAAASALYRALTPAGAWFLRPHEVMAGVGCAVAFAVLSTAIVAVAARLAQPGTRLAGHLRDGERIAVELTGTCAGVLVTIACALSPVLLVLTLPPVMMLQRSLLHAQLTAAARTDAKTGLLNAVAWQREAEAEVARALRRGEQAALLLADVDHFKDINDTYGHLAGDDLLRALAQELRRQVRESDIAGRYGGEEFVILLPRTTPIEARRVAERLRQGVGATVAGDEAVQATISIGVATLHEHGPDLPGLLAAADLALYAAKRQGRDRVCVYDPEAACPGHVRPPARGT